MPILHPRTVMRMLSPLAISQGAPFAAFPTYYNTAPGFANMRFTALWWGIGFIVIGFALGAASFLHHKPTVHFTVVICGAFVMTFGVLAEWGAISSVGVPLPIGIQCIVAGAFLYALSGGV